VSARPALSSIRCVLAAAISLSAVTGSAQETRPEQPPLALVQPEGAAGPPLVLTFRDALVRAQQNDAQFQASAADAANAREDRVQAKAGLLPSVSYTTQYLGNQANGVNPNGRFVSLDGVHMYRAWGVARQEVSANTFTQATLHKARAEEAAAAARLEVAERGLTVTVTRAYYALVVVQRRYATSQDAARQARRFLDITREQERLGQVARSDVVKADIQYGQLQQAYRETELAMDNARIALAVLISPTFTENFTVVDDLNAALAVPPFPEIRTMAARNNPELRAADEALLAAGQDVRTAKYALYPNLVVDAVYGIEANEFALHSRVAAQPELGVLPNLGYFVTVNLTVPVWDWGGLRSKVHQSETRERQAKIVLTQTQRQLAGSLYSKYNETVAAKSAVDGLQRVSELAAESLRLINLRYQAGESTALEVVDAQNTLVQARNAYDDAEARYRVAVADLQTLTGSF
jgi:outer membrane protein TolC